MTLQDLSNLGTFIAALATSISVLLALFTYRKGYQREALKNVREKIATYRIKYQEVNNLLDTSCSVELGVCISNEIKALVPRPHSTTAIAEFLENEDNVNYITQSCYLGLANAKAIQTSNELYVISSAEQEMFPITGKLLSTLSLYPSSVLTTINQTDYLEPIPKGIYSKQ
ncbi:hypothetical protein ACN08N_22910 [Photobacterium leiognathi subsp. mandapamensis]|uniref:hypothetical protein n=1 Tax=Photobacterium leiognathi TaxID=553611 RepID=UPI003AF404AA